MQHGVAALCVAAMLTKRGAAGHTSGRQVSGGRVKVHYRVLLGAGRTLVEGRGTLRAVGGRAQSFVTLDCKVMYLAGKGSCVSFLLCVCVSQE